MPGRILLFRRRAKGAVPLGRTEGLFRSETEHRVCLVSLRDLIRGGHMNTTGIAEQLGISAVALERLLQRDAPDPDGQTDMLC